MGRSCAACMNKYGDAKTRFFKVPDRKKHPELFGRWERFAEPTPLRNTSCICSAHFTDKDFVGACKAKLKPTAFPTRPALSDTTSKDSRLTHVVSLPIPTSNTTVLVKISNYALIKIKFTQTPPLSDNEIVVAKRIHGTETKHRRAKKAAMEKLKELTLSVQGSVKAVDLVRSVLKEVPPGVRALMPNKSSLVRKVRRWASTNNIQLVETDPEDEKEKREPIVAFKRIAPVTSSSDNAPRTSEEVKKSGVVSTEPVADLSKCTNKNKSSGMTTDATTLVKPTPTPSFPVENDDDGLEGGSNDDNDDDMCMDHEGDDFQLDCEDEPEPELAKTQLAEPLPNSSCTPTISSNFPSNGPFRQLPKDDVKSGERCFVCGDELLVSETLGVSEEIFRRACLYLNVKSEGEWFPSAPHVQFCKFCESCTNQVNKIQNLYRKVQEIQSVIFKEIESLEKRITNAGIADSWITEAPHSVAVRFEGFRKQVMINYRNKLKIRREVRFRRKIGQAINEVQPTLSAHMFAQDPTEMASYVAVPNESGSVRKKRIGPKSRMSVPQQDCLSPPSKKHYSSDIDEGHFYQDLNGSQEDAMSDTSAKEVKFWENDPSMLDVETQFTEQTKNTTKPPIKLHVHMYATSKKHDITHMSPEEKIDPDPKHKSPLEGEKVERNLNPNQATKQTLMCVQCDNTFELHTDLWNHQRTHYELHSKPSLMCQFCGKTYSDRKELSNHVLRCENNAEGEAMATTRAKFHCNTTSTRRKTELLFCCPKCPRKFCSRIGFRTHKRVCIVTKPLPLP